jgi:hypothetical protein
MLTNEEYDEFMETLADQPAGRYMEGTFAGDKQKSKVWLDVSGVLWCRTPRVPGRDLRCMSEWQVAAQGVALPEGEWPSTTLWTRLVAGGVAPGRASRLVHKLYKTRDCHSVLPDALVERIISQNRG